MAEKKNGGIVALALGIILALIKLWRDRKKEQAAASTPEKKAENDKKKFEEALASGDNAVINASFDQLRKKRNSNNNPG